MAKVMQLGKVDYNGSGRKINAVQLEWELRDGNFTMSGGVWNGSHTDFISCGQMCDEIGKLFPANKKVQRMVEVWRNWHLNDMKAGSPAQEAELAKHTFPGYPMSHYDWARQVLTDAGLQPDASYLHDGKPYSYGSAWLKKEIPAEVVAEIESW